MSFRKWAVEQGFKRLCSNAGIEGGKFHWFKHTAYTNMSKRKPNQLSPEERDYMCDHEKRTKLNRTYNHPDFLDDEALIEDIRAKLDADYQEPLIPQINIAPSRQFIQQRITGKQEPILGAENQGGYLGLSVEQIEQLNKLDWSNPRRNKVLMDLRLKQPQPSSELLNEKVLIFLVKPEQKALVPLIGEDGYRLEQAASVWLGIDPRIVLGDLRTNGMCIYKDCAAFTPEALGKFIGKTPELPVY